VETVLRNTTTILEAWSSPNDTSKGFSLLIELLLCVICHVAALEPCAQISATCAPIDLLANASRYGSASA
jgi:hypothetical protein